MQRILDLIRTTFLGGVLVVLPAWLAVLLFLKALLHLRVLVKPVSAHLPEGVGHPVVVSLAGIVALCFGVGLLLRTAIGRQVRKSLEHNLLERVPGYATLRSVAAQIGELEGNRGFKPALVEIEDALAPCFIIETHGDGRLTVFLPSAPTPAAGTILIINASRVHPVDVPVTKMFQCVTRWGTGSGELLAAMPSKGSPTNPRPGIPTPRPTVATQ